MASLELVKRQYYYDGYYDGPWYWIRWVILGGLLLILFIILALSYWHARRRMKNGQRPLAYHAWMIPWRQRAHLYETGYNNTYPSSGYYGNGYNVPLGTYPQSPPPMYYQAGQPPYNASQQNAYNPYPSYEAPYGAPQKN